MSEPTSPGERRQERLRRLTPEQRAEFQRRISGGGGAGTAPPAPRVPRRDPDAPVPLSFGQERLWFVEQLQPGTAGYNEYVGLWLTGELDVPALEGALGGIVARHEALRTVIAEGPVQRVLPAGPFRLPVVRAADRAAALALAEAEAARPMDLAAGPLFRALLVRVDEQRSLLVVSNHHMVGDAWSRAVLLGELAAGYRAARDGGPQPPPPPVQYADWASWHRARLTDEACADDLAYWRERLAGAPPVLDLATDRPRPATPSYRGGRVHFTLDADLTARLERLARSAGATPFMVLLTAWNAVLHRWSGQTDVVVGSPVAGRALPELEPLVGLFVNSLVLRSDVSGDPTFAELLGRAREVVLGALAHDGLPFERLVRELRPERHLNQAPLFQVLFGMRNVPMGELSLPGVAVEVAELDNGLCRYDLAVDLAVDGDRVTGVCEYSRDLFDEATVEAMVGMFATVLDRALTDPEQRLGLLVALPDDARAELDAGNDTTVPLDPADGALPGFARQVAAKPDAVALTGTGWTLTYRQLDERVAELAGRLRAAGVTPGDRVGLCLRRTPDLVAAMLAAHRVGAAYLPLDPSYPQARLQLVAADAGARLVLVHRHTRDAAPAGSPLLDLDAAADPAARPVPAPAAAPDPALPAYVIYTSGSTGTPKGVVVTHGNLTNFLVAMDRELAGTEPVTWLALTSVSFDISVLELLWTLSRGHRVVLTSDVPTRRSAPTFSLFYFASAATEPGEQQYRLLQEGARFADDHGFEAVWLPERHFHSFGGPFPAPSVLAASLAVTTTRVGLRAGSVVLPLHHPVRVAEEWSVVDNLSGGRVGVSFATGWHVDDFVLAKDAYTERQDVTVRALDEVRRLWRGERVAFAGPGDREVPVAVLPRPVQPELPVWFTSSGNPQTFRTAGRLGARLLTHLLGQSVPELGEKIALYRAAWREAGHPGDGHVTLMVHTLVGTDEEAVRTAAWQPFRDYLRSSLGLIENLARGLGLDIRSADFTEDDAEALLDHACARYFGGDALLGTVEQCRPLVERLAAVGVDEVACLIDFGVDPDAVLTSLPALDELRRTAGAVAADEPPLTDLVAAHGVTHLQCTPSQARMLLAEPGAAHLARLRELLLGGEALDLALVRQVRGVTDARIRNMYGPTETTVWSTCEVVGDDAVTIGRPLANTVAYVLDEHGGRVPVGVPGELHLGGAGVAAGYLDRPALTAERFLPDPWRDGGRMYRTGDLARFRRDGRLEFLGRRDHQVKLRGFRIELGEVEVALAGVPGVAHAAAAVSGTTLVGYVVPEPGRVVTADAVRERLAGHLPPYLVPTRVVLVDHLPTTPNGKLDRAALPALGGDRPDLGRPYVAPGTDTERRIAAIWQELLELDRVGVTDDFFQLGGHSLLATQLVTRLRRDFAVELPLRMLFERPTVADLARAVSAATGADESAPVAALVPDPAHRYDPFPLTDVQRAYWIGRGGQLDGGDVSCHLYVELEVPDVDLDRLTAAWRGLVDRHDMLRAVVEADGRQRVLATVPEYVIGVTDLVGAPAGERDAALAQLRDRMSHQVLPADVWPLFELRATRLEPTRTRLHLSIDTLIADGGSVQILLRELLTSYQGTFAAKPMELSFRDYVLNEEALRQGPRHEADQAYWRGRLDELPAAPELPVRPRPDVATRFVRREAWLDADRWSALQARAAQRRVTPSALLLTAYAQVLGTWAEQDRFTLNLTLFNRNGDHPDLPALVGDFTALSLLAVDAATTGAFARRAERVQRQLWDDLDHRTMSGVQVVRELGQRRGMAAARMPVVFTSELGAGASDQRALLAGLGAEVVYTVTQTPQVWLDHQVGEDAGALRLTWDSVDAIFPDGMVDAMFAAYTDLLRRLADDGDAWSEPRPVTTPAADLAVVAATNDTAAPVPQGLLHEPFAARARQRPDATAVVSATGTVTYGELDRAADAAAATLQGRGVAPGDVVGVLMGRGWEQVAAVLGVLRAGAAYLPLDDGLPTARVAHVLRHAGARAVLVTEASERTDGMPDDVPAIRFAPDAVATPAPVPGDPDALAYVIYTSGSTGEPKGVMISHRGARNTIDHLNERFAVGPHDRVFGISGLGFDLSVYDVFGTLAAGGTLVLSAGDATRDPARWRDLIGRHGVTVWNSVPALMEMLLAHTGGAVDPALASLRLVWLSGDWIPVGMPDAIRSSCPGATVVSMGGATEASIWSVAYPVGRVDPDWPSIPYGRPLPNQSLHVLDEQLRPRPLWVPGDLYIGGVGVALGYRRAPELTEAAYLTHPDTGERLYRTGDRARFLGDGVVEFLGRRDSQVKVRGMRIELGEIEATLVRQDGVREAAVVVHGRGSAQQLVGFVVAEQPTAPTGQAAPPDPRRLAELDERLRRPAVRRDLADHRRVPLPAPGDAGTLSGQVRRWRSASTFAPGRLTVGTVGDLLAVLGQQLVDGLPRAAYASAGGRFPVQVYLSVHGAGVEGLAGGLYYHDPSAHTLTQLTDAALEAALYDAGNQPLFASSSFALFLVSKPSALGAGYAAYADRFCLLEAGSMAQLLRQRAPEVGAALCGIGDVHFPPLRDALALEPDQALLYSLLGGVDPAGVAGLEGGLRAALAERLPEYMVPRRIHLVDALPLSANGKVDRQALAARVDTGTTATAAAAPAAVAVVAAPTGDTLARLTRIWQELLETDTVDPTRNFFELGANSIHLVHAQRRIGEEFGREVSVTQLFDRPTLTDLAELLDGGPAADGADPQALPQQRRDHRARRRAARRAEGADDV